ncbi:MAG: hypothetical protein EKK48_30180 [Candidatus Melainabacteria bacterium]|nr:MAG: hypothetical protein EKK48_30180 [Candidatus Melainabacteria bacterium]
MPGTFAHALQKSTFHVYDSDDGKSYLVKMMPKYESASGLPVADATQINTLQRYPNQHLCRHAYLSTTDDAGAIHRRFVIVGKNHLSSPGTPGNIDGLTGWAFGGQVGERIRK